MTNIEILNNAINGRALESITELDLSNKNLTELPEKIGKLKNLSVLD